jgi:serine/threonine protein kinase
MGDQVQTATADMWSLGMVTLALLAPLTNTELQSMSQTDQFDLNEVIEAVISRRRSPQPSYHGRAFVHHCLQRNPLERLTTQEAAKHIWLCSPRKYVEYFQLLDQKMMQSFRIQEQFRPIPWEIPQTEDMDIDRDESQSDMPTSGYLPTKASFTPSCAAERSKFFRESHISNGCSTQESGEGLSQLTPEIFKTEPIISLTPASTPNDSGSIDGKILAKDDDPSTQNQRVAETKRKREALSKTCVTTVFPRTGLGRHLEEARAKDRRMELLEELKSTNSKCFSA